MWWMDLQYWPGPKEGFISRVKLDQTYYRSGESVYMKTSSTSQIRLGTVLEVETFMFGEHAGETWVTYFTRN